MKKIMLLAALLAMVLVAAVPAIAQVANGVGGQEQESGDTANMFTVENTGANSNQCAGALQFGQTGNIGNSQGVLQYDSESGDIEFAGNEVVFFDTAGPANAQDCAQQVQQSSAASSTVMP